MALTNYQIKDLESFEDTTSEPRQIAGLYFYELLECLIDLAYKISADFRKRPQLYRDLGDPSTAALLAEFNAKYGTEANLLSASERNEIYTPIFGTSDVISQGGGDNFAHLRNELVRAAMTFAQGAQQLGVPMLREAVRSAHQPFKDYLLNLHGDSVRFSKEIALSHLTEKVSYPILRNQHIAANFGVTKIADVDYPYATDPARDLLVEQIDLHLTWRTDNTQGYGKLTRERISNLQRVALRGAEALATILDFDAGDSDDDLDHLITKCHVWGTTLGSVRAGTRPAPTQQTQPSAASGTPTIQGSRVASR